jgi:hypothetical protein
MPESRANERRARAERESRMRGERENGERTEREQRERRGERRALLLERSEQRITESLPEADRARGLSPSLGVKNDESVDVVKCHERRGERAERGEESLSPPPRENGEPMRTDTV